MVTPCTKRPLLAKEDDLLVLMVDDSRTARTLFSEILNSQPKLANCTLIYAVNGLDALAKIRIQKPDVVVADINMPEMDGIKLLRAIRAQALSTRFGFMTADRSAGLRIRAFQEGADFFLYKGCTIDLIQDAVLGEKS